jgi:hypothetical protein
MLGFIQSQSSVVEGLLYRVKTPSIVDLLVCIIQLDEHPLVGGAGVLEVCSYTHSCAHSLTSRLCLVVIFRTTLGEVNKITASYSFQRYAHCRVGTDQRNRLHGRPLALCRLDRRASEWSCVKLYDFAADLLLVKPSRG